MDVRYRENNISVQTICLKWETENSIFSFPFFLFEIKVFFLCNWSTSGKRVDDKWIYFYFIFRELSENFFQKKVLDTETQNYETFSISLKQ